jgi:hypothetical protein
MGRVLVVLVAAVTVTGCHGQKRAPQPERASDVEHRLARTTDGPLGKPTRVTCRRESEQWWRCEKRWESRGGELQETISQSVRVPVR